MEQEKEEEGKGRWRLKGERREQEEAGSPSPLTGGKYSFLEVHAAEVRDHVPITGNKSPREARDTGVTKKGSCLIFHNSLWVDKDEEFWNDQ